MKAVRFATLLGALSLAWSSACSVPPEQPGEDYWAGPLGAWQPTFVDDFDGPAGSSPNPTSWNMEVVASPYNKELQYYTNRASNVALDGSGHLVLTARSERFVDATGQTSNQPYTSGRVNSKGRVEATYGRIEARIKVPAGKGLWPAFWMLGGNIDSVGWPQCGEVDIFELGGSNPALVIGSLHAPGYNGGTALHAHYTKEAGTFADDYHLYAFEWTAQGMRWLVDEVPFAWRTPEGLQDIKQQWYWDHPMFIVLNLAVGGIYDGTPDANTPMPSVMLVDYVKVSKLVQ